MLLRPAADAVDRRTQVRATLRAGGLLTELPAMPAGLTPLSAAERGALARSLPANLNLSQVIVEGREESY